MSARADVFAGVVPFVRTAELRSFGRAAAELGVTTAAVSKAVRRLEDDLGVRLLERSSRQVALTRAGAVFLERCRPALLGVQGARDAVRGAAREPHGELALTLPVILAPFVVPGLGRLRAQYPRLAFRVHLSDRIARLAEESYDVAIRMGALADSDLVARKLRHKARESHLQVRVRGLEGPEENARVDRLRVPRAVVIVLRVRRASLGRARSAAEQHRWNQQTQVGQVLIQRLHVLVVP